MKMKFSVLALGLLALALTACGGKPQTYDGACAVAGVAQFQIEGRAVERVGQGLLAISTTDGRTLYVHSHNCVIIESEKAGS